MIVFLLVILTTSAYTLSAQSIEEKENYQAYGKLHLGFTLEEEHNAINAGGSFGFYLGEHFGLGFGTGLLTYHKNTPSTLTEGGGIECYVESLIEPLSRTIALSVFTGISFLRLEDYPLEQGSCCQSNEYAKKQALIGMALDYYILPELSLGLRANYAFLEDYGSYWPSVRVDLSLGTRF